MARYTCNEYELELLGATFKFTEGGRTVSGRVHRERDKLILEAQDVRWEAKFNGENVEVDGIGTFVPR